MFDYSLNKNDKKSFILYYKKVGNKLKVYLANGKKDLIPSTEDNELYLLKQMEQQVLEVEEFKNVKEKNKKNSFRYFCYNMSFVCINTLVMAINPGLITGIITSLFTLCSLVNFGTYIKNKIILNDIKKHEMFMKNKVQINEELRKKDNSKELTINDIHTLKSKDLEINTFSEQTNKSQHKVLIKKYK